MASSKYPYRRNAEGEPIRHRFYSWYFDPLSILRSFAGIYPEFQRKTVRGDPLKCGLKFRWGSYRGIRLHCLDEAQSSNHSYKIVYIRDFWHFCGWIK